MRSPSTWIGAVFALACGGVLGFVLTIAHRAAVVVAGATVPTGLLLGLVSIGAFLAALRVLEPGRIPALGGALGVVGAVLVLATQGLGGRVVVADEPIGYAWLLGALVVSAGAVVWPRGRSAARDTMETQRQEDPL